MNAKRPQARSLGLHELSPPAWAKMLVACGGRLCLYSRTLKGCRVKCLCKFGMLRSLMAFNLTLYA